MKRLSLALALPALAAVLILPTGCATPVEIPVIAAPDHSVFAPATAATNQLGLELYRQLAAAKPGENLLLSPYSIQSALAMTYAGADGDTRTEMARVLHFPDDDAQLADAFGALRNALNDAVEKSNHAQADIIDSYRREAANVPQEIQDLKKESTRMPPEYLAQMQREAEQRARDDVKTAQALDPHPTELRVANRLFGQQDFAFRPTFLDFTRDRYGAPLQPLDFKTASESARDTINAWVADQTKNKITDLLPSGSVGPGTRLVLVNALYFKAPWQDKFDKKMTEELVFKVRGRQKTEVPTMYNYEECGYAKVRGYTAVTLPYLGGDLQLLILLPDADNGVDALAAALTPDLLRRCAKLNQDDIRLWLPKFKFEPPTIKLADELKALGLRQAFDEPAGSANFDRMAPRKPDAYLAVSDVFHKTFFALDEESTEAAAATAVNMMVATAAMPSGPPPPPPPEVHVDHPFLFAIQHRESGACLFFGRVTDPR